MGSDDGSNSQAVGGVGPLADFVAGAFGGVAICVITHPFDTVKVLMQANAAKYGSAWATTRAVVSTSPLSLFRGMSSPLATIPIVNAVVFWAYGGAKRTLQDANGGASLSTAQTAVAGAWAGLVNSLVVAPAELAKVQLQQQAADRGGVAATGGGMRFRGPLHFLAHTVQQSGVRSACRGMVATILRESFAYGAQFVVYEALLRAVIRRHAHDHHHDSDGALSTPAAAADDLEAHPSLTSADFIVAGGLAGVAAWTFSFPWDVVKTRLQALPVVGSRPAWAAPVLGLDGGVTRACRHVAASGGWSGFWRGFGPCIVPAFPANAAGFLVYQWVTAVWPHS